MSKAVKSAVKVFVITLAVATGAAFLLAGTSLASFGVMGAFIGGVSTTTIAAMSALSTLVGGLMSKGVDAVGENFGSKISTRSATNPRQIIYGKARVGGTVTHIETSGTDNHKLSMIVSLAGHELESLDEVLINDISITSTSVGLFQYATNPKFKNTDNDNKFDSNGTLLRYKFIDGSQTTADSSVTANTSLTTSDKFIDIAYVFIEMVFDSEAFGGGIPPMSFVVKGKKVYDPRDSNQTFGTESTYTWSDNPALCVLDYITNTTYGLKATADEINTSTALGSFKVAANTCDIDTNTITTATVNGAVSGTQVTLDISNSITLIDVGQIVTGTGIVGTVKVASRDGNIIKLSSAQTIADGTTLTIKEKSYTANGITNMSADGGGVIEGLLSSCAGKLSYIDGKFVMFAGASVTPDMTITDDNLLAPITVQTRQTSGETFNQVKSVYIDANNNYVATDSPLETTTNPDTSNTFLSEDTPTGEAQANYKKTLEVQLPFTDTTTMAQRLQRTALLHTRQKTALSVVCNIAYMQLQPFDWVYLTNERLGYTNKVFEVLSTNLEILEKDGVQVLATRLDLKEINNSVYSFASSSYTNPLDEGSSVSTGSFSVSPPTSLAVATTLEITGHDLNVSWTNNPDDLVQGTEVFYGTSSGTYIGSFIVGKGIAKESINGVKASTTYYIAVRHFSANNVFSALTSEVTVTTGTAPISYSTGGGNVGGTDTINILGKNLVLNRFNSTSGGEDNENYTFLNSGNGAIGGVTSFQNSDTERVQLFFGEDIGGDFTNQFIALDADWNLGKGGANGSSTGTSKLIIKGRAYGSSTGTEGATSTIATFNAITNTDGYAFPTVELAPTTISGSTTTPIVEVSQGSAPSTTTNKLYNVGGTLYWNGAVVDTGAGDITGVTITTSGQSGLTGGASFASGDATFTLAIASTINGSKTFSDDVVVEGDLTVEGTTTTIDTTNLDVQDKNITLNYGSGDTSANANGAGITIQDAVSATQDATLTWNTTNDSFNFSHPLNVTGDITANTENAELQLIDTSSGNTTSILSNNFDTSISADGRIFFRAGGSTDNIIQITSGGDVAFYEDTGTNTNLVWDASESRLQHKDNAKATFGDSSDLQIYHDGSNSYINDTGDGFLKIGGASKVEITNNTNTERMAVFKKNNAVELYYDNDKKFETTSTGIDVTGTIVGDGLTIQGATNLNGSVKASVNSSSTGLGNHVSSIRINNTDSTVNNWSALVFDSNSGASAEVSARFIDHTNNYADLYLITRGTGGYTTKLNIGSDGDVDIVTGDLQLGGQTVISSARNITAGTIDSGAIDATGAITSSSALTGNRVNITDATAPYITFTEGSNTVNMGLDNGNFWIRQNGLGGGDEIKINSDGTLVVNHNSTFNGNITVTGTVDGRDIATDGTKLDGIEAGATTDQTQADINALAITEVGTITSGTWNGSVIASAYLDADTAHLSGTQTFTGDKTFADNKKAIFGTGGDLEIYHDGSNSYIAESGTGSLYIQGQGNIYLQDDTGAETYARFQRNNAVKLYFDNDLKFATTSTGIDVTGTVTSDGLTVNGSGTINQSANTDINGLNGLRINDSTGTGYGAIGVVTGNDLRITSGDAGGTNDKAISFRTANAGTERQRLRIGGTGDISFYEDTGTTAKLFWDASTERLGINTSAPLHPLSVNGVIHTTSNIQLNSTAKVLFGNGNQYITGTNDTSLELATGGTTSLTIDNSGNLEAEGNTTLSGDNRHIYFGGTNTFVGERSNSTHLELRGGGSSASQTVYIDNSGRLGLGTALPTNGNLQIGDSDADFNIAVAGARTKFGYDSSNNSTVVQGGITKGIIFCVNNSTFGSGEAGRFDSSGNLLVAQSSIDTNTAGHIFLQNGSAYHIRNGGTTGIFNRKTSDGTIVAFQKDGANVGSIGAYSGNPYIESSSNFSLMLVSSDIRPRTVGGTSNNDGTIDLGVSSSRFRDLHLSGTANVGSGLQVGSIGNIGNRANDIVVFSSSTGHNGLRFHVNGILPTDNTGAIIDADADLGIGTHRFKDLHLSGTANVNTIASTGDLTLDATGDINLDAEGNDIKLKDGGTEFGRLSNSSLSLQIFSPQPNADINFVGNDDGSTITALALNMSAGGNATFNNDVSVTNELNVGQQITASGGITTDQTGQTISGFTTIRVGDALIGQDVATLTTTATTQTNRILASATTYRTLKVLVQIKSSTNFHATEILLTHNGTTVYMTEYATIFSNNSLATFDADISGGNIRLLIDPNQSASTEFKFNVSGINA